MGFPGSSVVKESACSAGDTGDLGLIPGSGRAPASTLVFLPGESHGQRSLVGYRPWGQKESDTTEGTEHTAHTLVVTVRSLQAVKSLKTNTSLQPSP